MPGKLLDTLVRPLVCHTATQSLMSVPREGNLRRPGKGETTGVLETKSTYFVNPVVDLNSIISNYDSLWGLIYVIYFYTLKLSKWMLML
ncbi:60S ribosomal protein L18-3 [Iris pallida]|uniref:60S ribosomal protein L18-3 n=1 Tax=Iris pallida TaxID=29817 RepID=A0AAX6EHG4_IRIPA|nr:60S ribosomal protein L18-3 [Iris pallida]